MKKKLIFLTFTFVLIFVFLLITTKKNNIAVSASENVDTETAYNQSEYRDQSFYRVYKKWLSEGKRLVNLDSALVFNKSNVTNAIDFEELSIDGQTYLKVLDGETINFQVDVETSGLYEIGLSYYLEEEFYTNPEIEIKINGENAFSETDAIALEVSWNIEKRDSKNRYNSYGDEMLPYSRSLLKQYNYYLKDENETYDFNYKFYLNSGENTIQIKNLTSDILYSSLSLFNQKSYSSFSAYDMTKNRENGSSIITIEAEDFIDKNSLSIKQSYYKDPGITPFEYKNSVLNILNGSSVSEGGSSVTYEVDVKKDDYYSLTFKYLHNSNLGVVSSRNIYIDGVIPYLELENYLFATERKWTNESLSSASGETLYIYLTKGIHTISLESSLSYKEELIDELNSIMDWINKTGLNIKVITGGETSSIITQYITSYLPSLEEDLLFYAQRLGEIYQIFEVLDEGIKNSSPELTSLKVAEKQMIKLAKKPNRINSKLNLFCDGSGSAYQLVGDAITSLSSSPLDIDKIYLSPMGREADIPKAQSNFFLRLWTNIKSFFYSFFDDRYKLKNSTEENTLNVWVEQSSLYADIIQNMADSEDFGYDVKINILPSVSKLVLSHSTKDNPDVVLSLDTWEPYAMALRGMLEPLNNLEGFTELIKDTESGNFVPLIYQDGVYGIPETTSTFLLYYRKDVLESLNIEVPDTWQDVLEILPTLQSYSMNFFHPMSSDTSYKSFGMVSPFFYQFNAEVFSYDSLTSTLEDENTLKAMKFLTELYTVYNFPQQISSFFESFRSGNIPIGVSSIDLYLQLQYAAPEISGQWAVTVLPGIYDTETSRVERWSASYGKCSVIFDNTSMKEEAWDFIKWWNQSGTQVEYMKNIKMTLGERYLVVPANMEALRLSVWDEQIKDMIEQQAKWSMVPAVTPGSYIVEREISQIWNKVVIDKVPLRQAISESVPKINRELYRKLDEFHFIDANGNSIYRVPLASNINTWLRRDE